MNKTLKLHIGIHKTGSTSIQAWMHWLDANGLLPLSYPKSSRAGFAHHKLYSEFAFNGNVSPWRRLREECLQPNHEVTLASAEELSMLSTSQIKDLLSEFPGEGVRLQIIVFLRSPASFLTSLYFQRLKTGVLEPLPTVESSGQLFTNRIKAISQWASRVGKENISVSPYPGGPASGNTLWNAWWKAVGIPAPIQSSDLPDELSSLNVCPPLPVLAALFQLLASWQQRGVGCFPGYAFSQKITRKMTEHFYCIAPSMHDSAPILFGPSEVETVEKACQPILDELLAMLDCELPFFPRQTSPARDSDRLWFVDPEHSSLPVEERRIVASLVEYGEALAAEEMERTDAVVSPRWLG